MFRGKREPLCREVRDRLSEYLDSKLDSENKSLVEHHLETCEACSQELASLRMTVQLLHRVPVASVPRSFTVTVPQPRRESAFGPASLRWLRPATAIVAMALVVLLMGDFLFGFENNVYDNTGTYNLTTAEAANPEQRIMVAVPGVMGEMSLATAKSVGYTDYSVVRSVPTSALSAAPQPMPTVSDNKMLAGTGGAEVVADQSEAGGGGWPLRQIEIGLGAAVFVLLALIIYARRQHKEKVGAR